MDPPNIIDLVIKEKQFSCYQMISRGKFSATIEINDDKDKKKKIAVLLMTKNKSESRKFDFEKIQNAYTVQALQYEYLRRLQTYLIYTETGVCTLKDKIEDKLFRASPLAIECVFDWIKQVSMGLKKLHATGFVHLNIHPNTIVITSENRAKLSGFNFTRHTSTERNSYETGSEACYRPPESFVRIGINGMKYDTWCLAVLTIEALTKNYVAQKSKKITTWPQQYDILFKVLKPHKFKKLVRKAYPTAKETTNLEKCLLLIKHTLKFHPGQRPSVGEFYLLLFELTFLKDIDKELAEEKIWKKKGSRNKEIIVFPLEYIYLHQSEVLPTALESSVSKKVETRKPDPHEKGDANNEIRENTDEDSFFSEQKTDILQDSEFFSHNPLFNNLDLAVRKEDAEIGETAKRVNKNNLHQSEVLPSVLEQREIAKSVNNNNEKKGNRVKRMFQKIFSWTLDETFYTGVKHNGSFINDMSKALTG